MVDKQTKLLTTILSEISKINEKIETIENRMSALSNMSENITNAKKILEIKKILTQRELMSELGLSKNSNRSWKEIKEGLEEQKIADIHTGMGSAKTTIIYKNENSALSIASELFKKLNKKKDYNLSFVMKEFNIDEKKARLVLKEMYNIFPERIKLGMDNMFKKEY